MKEDKLSPDTQHPQVQDFNTIVAARHGKPRRLIRPTLGFEFRRPTFAIITGLVVMRVLEKGQEALLRALPGVAGAVSLVHRAVGLV